MKLHILKVKPTNYKYSTSTSNDQINLMDLGYRGKKYLGEKKK